MEVKALDRTLPDDIYDVSDANQTSIIQVFCEDDWTVSIILIKLIINFIIIGFSE